jgi:hypothetical protein
MRILKTTLKPPTNLAFSPDGTALAIFGDRSLRVWPDWLREKPKRGIATGTTLERVAFAPDGRTLLLYLSCDSRTRALTLDTLTFADGLLRKGGPAWFHFDTAGGFAIVHHDNALLSRYDYAPKMRGKFRKKWTVNRRAARKEYTYIVSYYRFGAVCAAAGTFTATEVHIGGPGGTVRDLVVRATADGAEVYRERLNENDSQDLTECVGPRFAVHPSGAYCARTGRAGVAFRALAKGGTAPAELELPRARRKKADAPTCTAVAFAPTGAHLLAADDRGAVTLFDCGTWQPLRTMEWGIGPLCAAAFTADGTRAAAVAPGKVVIWDVDL